MRFSILLFPVERAEAFIEIPLSTQEVISVMQTTLTEVVKSFFERVPYLIAGVLVLLLTWIAVAVAERLTRKTLHSSTMRPSLKKLFGRFVVIGIWILGVLLSALIVFPGLTPTKALGAMGLVSVAVGFAFKDIFENFFAGILLLWRFPFEDGDFIECQDIMGEVEDVTVRMTQIRLVTGELMVLPNSFLFKNPVRIITSRRIRRIGITAGVAYGENVSEAAKVIERAVKSCETVSKESPVQVFPSGFGSSGVDIEVVWWTGSRPLEERRSRGEVVAAIKSALDAAGIEIPFPYRTITFKEPLNAFVSPMNRSRSSPEFSPNKRRG